MKLKLKEIVWWGSDEDDVNVIPLEPAVEKELEMEREIPTLIDLYVKACRILGVEPYIPPKIRLVYDSKKGDQFINIYTDTPNIPYAVNEEVFYDGEEDDVFDEEAYDDCHFYRDMRCLELWRIEETVKQNVERQKAAT